MIEEMFVIGCWPDSTEKMQTLRDTIRIVRAMMAPILLCTHYPISERLDVDYFIYDRNNILSGDFRPLYWRRHADGRLELRRGRIPYHGVAVLNNIRNAVDFCRGRARRIHYFESDVRLDLAEFLRAGRGAVFAGIGFDGDKGIRTDIWSANTDWLDYAIPRISSWEEYMEGLGEGDYVLEHWILKRWKALGLAPPLYDFPVTNLYDQVDKKLWEDVDAEAAPSPQ